jgi:aspartyl-tRNA(Asn)/glutamyl-tRNA(Gln) amidotransferase subunit C
MRKLSRDDVLKLARLSRLKLTDEEIEAFSIELSKILDYVEKLNLADTDGFEPVYQVTGLKNVMRDDEPHDYTAKPKELLKNAPAIHDGQFKVKRVL